MDLIKDGKTAKQMMMALEDVFHRKSVFSKLTPKKKLLTLKLKKEEKLVDHFLNFDMIIGELKNIGSKIEESNKVCHLLLSLSGHCDLLIIVIEALNNEVTMGFVKSVRLLDKEMKKSRFLIKDDQDDAAFKAYC